MWLDKSEGDGKIVRTLEAPRPAAAAAGRGPGGGGDVGPIKVKVTVTTSDVRGAGTDANVTINIHGSKGGTGPLKLTSSKDNFERGNSDTFFLDSVPDYGTANTIDIGHDGSGFGAGWHLASVEVTNLASGEVTTFPCNRWLDKSEDDGATTRTLTGATVAG
eukprot:CAMPEP_0182904224 /NCGR_PEP_ID=MMETSP0034_2-20130328/31943_1 /TAXON_ID=156128 /ORGANISM="Nephroselmis pyriformis, Strain CCMP717" /LENGTH=161 /DNA_ID=CAMNT_0025039337 /DNA_START=10 /DNA_END=491 /DNA_ORIENTATION=-